MHEKHKKTEQNPINSMMPGIKNVSMLITCKPAIYSFLSKLLVCTVLLNRTSDYIGMLLERFAWGKLTLISKFTMMKADNGCSY